ncbi:MAG TPA: penicillin-binding transpeptidase domain-containing protein, partial [Iamia sp.]|nr:penicillin-binding transpeptidase domain-containing protein [Iamia sp.]
MIGRRVSSLRGRPGLVAAALLAVAVIGAGVVIVTRSADPSARDDGVRTETVMVEGQRGRILDRSGKVLVEDATVLEVRADRDEVDALDAGARTDLLDALAGLLVADPTGSVPPPAGVASAVPASAALLAEALDSPDDEVVLATGVGDEVREAIASEPDRFAGITVTAVGRRTYHYGALAAHVLGYSGRVTDDERQARSDEDLPEDAIVGQAGIEQALDAELRGTPGQIVYEVDAGGQRVRELTDRRTEPERGRDVHLTLDINMQYLIEKGLAAEIERRRGVVDNGCFLPGGCDPQGAASVAVDPRNGQVLAMASYPTYDPNLFVGGISSADLEAISSEDRGEQHHFPLLNRAIAGQFAPGSTFKLFSAHAGLAHELITPEDIYLDTGTYLYDPSCTVENPENNCSATNPGAMGTGSIDLREALTLSSDTYFYKLGDDSWRAKDRIG